MSTENLNVSDDSVRDNREPETKEKKSKTVPVFQLTNDLETHLDELQRTLDANEKQFLATMEKIESTINKIGK